MVLMRSSTSKDDSSTAPIGVSCFAIESAVLSPAQGLSPRQWDMSPMQMNKVDLLELGPHGTGAWRQTAHQQLQSSPRPAGTALLSGPKSVAQVAQLPDGGSSGMGVQVRLGGRPNCTMQP